MNKPVQIGTTHGRLTVLCLETRDGYKYAICECSCGNETRVRYYNLRRGSTKSCGCLRTDAIIERHRVTGNKKIGKSYGALTVIRKAGLNKRGIMTFVCRCGCGKEVTVDGGNLTAGHHKSCGCMRWNREAFRKPRGEAGLSQLISRMKSNARRRGYEWNLTDGDVRRITKEKCHYCGKEPSQIMTCSHKNASNVSIEAIKHSEYIYNGIDRANNDLGYTLDNVVPCCGSCNKAKLARSQKEFREWVVRAYRYLNTWEVKE